MGWAGMQVIEPAALHLIDSSVTDSVMLHESGGGIACDGRCTMMRGQIANNRAISGAGVRAGGAFDATGVAIVNNLIDPSLRVGCSMPVVAFGSVMLEVAPSFPHPSCYPKMRLC